jgi:DNA-binding NarL/FixJ family response regulator
VADPLRIVVVETWPEMHAAIAAVLEGAPDLQIVKHARSLRELSAAAPEAIDVVVADLVACVGSAPALAQLRQRYPGMRLVVSTVQDGPEYREAIARVAADAWVHKPHLADHLVDALRRLPR